MPVKITYYPQPIEQLRSAYDGFLALVALELLGNMIEECPVDEGRLSGSHAMKKKGYLRYVVGTNVEYAPDVIFGTKPHEIRPKTKKVLLFYVNGEPVFATHVFHPGTAPNPYPDRAITRTQARTGDLASMAVTQAGL